MLAIKNLENLIKIENDLKSQYEEKLSTQDAKIEKSIKQIDELLGTIAKQKESLIELSSASADKKRIEQTNRELHNRSANLQAEIDGQKKRIKALQNDLSTVRAEVKTLKQLDADKLKKNLVANKKKLAEKTTSNDLLQKSLNKTKTQNTELQREISELKAKLEELEPAKDADIETAEPTAAA